MANPMLDDALGVLLGDAMAHVVELVLCARDGAVEAHARTGAVAFDRAGARRVLRGVDPLARTDPGTYSPLDEELAAVRAGGVYPFAYDNAAQLFENRRAPDLAVVHTGAHNWEERGGHRGEHGSLGLVQSRAPLIVSGAGAARAGTIEAAARMIDVTPTLARLCGAGAPIGEGRVLDEALDPRERPDHVVAFLCDGSNANVLYAMAEAGELPAVARLMAEGTTYRHGLIASFPSVTLANHTTALTGVHPGGHGVLNNFYFDRETGEQIVANAPQTWHLARGLIAPDVPTLFEHLAPLGFAAAINEPVDRGAASTTFDLIRAAGGAHAMQAALPNLADVPGATAGFADQKREYGFATAVDHLAVQQATALWRGEAGNPRPRFTWINLILPDAANHAGGPYSDIGHAGLRDTDRRLGEILDAMDWGAGRTAFMLLADHGMEESDPACKGDFDEALVAAGIPFRDEGYGFVYLDP